MRCDAATCRPTTRPCAPRPEPYILKIPDVKMDMEGRKGSVVEEINCALGMRKKKKQRTSEFMFPLVTCKSASAQAGACLLAAASPHPRRPYPEGSQLRVCVSACLHLAAYPHPILSSSTRWGMVDAADTKSVLNRSANPGPGSLHAWQAGRWHRRPVAGPPGVQSGRDTFPISPLHRSVPTARLALLHCTPRYLSNSCAPPLAPSSSSAHPPGSHLSSARKWHACRPKQPPQVGIS